METESDIMCFAQPSDESPSQYIKMLVTETQQCGDVYKGYVFNEISNERLIASICNSMRACWEN